MVFRLSIAGRGEPQFEQNTVFQPSGLAYSFLFSAPFIHRTLSGRAQRTALDPVPDTLRHLEQ
jgi:hypothetical protein